MNLLYILLLVEANILLLLLVAPIAQVIIKLLKMKR